MMKLVTSLFCTKYISTGDNYTNLMFRHVFRKEKNHLSLCAYNYNFTIRPQNAEVHFDHFHGFKMACFVNIMVSDHFNIFGSYFEVSVAYTQIKIALYFGYIKNVTSFCGLST